MEESTSYIIDHCIKSRDGKLIGLEIEFGHVEYTDLDIGSTHVILGHPSNYLTNLTAEKMRLKSTHVEATCANCIRAKQKQKNVPKYVDFKAEEPGEKVFHEEQSFGYIL